MSQFTQTDGERLPSEREVRYTYEVSPHYDLFGTFRFTRFGQWDPTQVLSNHRLVKAFRFEDNPCVLDAQVMDGRLNVHLRASGVLPSDDQVTRLFGLHRPSLAVEGHPFLERISREKKGIHLGQSTHLGMDLIKTTFQQLIEWRDAATIWRRWILQAGTRIPGTDLYCPPAYSEVNHHTLDLLHGCGLSRKRAALVREIARLGPRLDGWASESASTIRRRLMSIRGIGAWTTEHCLGFSFNEDDVVVTGDFQLPHTVAWALAGQARGSDQRMLELLEPWAGRRWHVLRLIFASDIRAPRRGPRLNPGRPSRPRPISRPS